jgi:hypothetical protein
MVTSGALYRRRFSGMGETRSMTGGFDEIVYNNIKREEEDVRSLHFSYSVTSESQPPSRKSSFRIRRANGDKSETDSRSVISDGVNMIILFCSGFNTASRLILLLWDTLIGYKFKVS